VLHLAHLGLPEGLLTFFCGFFPALGGALAAINNQGEFRRTAKRSHAMHEVINRKITRIDALCLKIANSEDNPTSFLREAQELAGDAANVLVREVLDWRVLFLDRPPEMGA
jgi:hypothetical protein